MFERNSYVIGQIRRWIRFQSIWGRNRAINSSIQSIINFIDRRNSTTNFKIQGKSERRGSVDLDWHRCDTFFISQQTTTRLGLMIQLLVKYKVMIGTGEKVMGASYCRELYLKFLATIVRNKFLILPLTNIHIILGLKWMQYWK